MGTDDRNTAQWRCTSLFASTETCTPQHREGGRIDDQRMGTRSEHPTQAMGTRSASEAQWVHSTSQHPFWLLMYRDFLRESLTCVEADSRCQTAQRPRELRALAVIARCSSLSPLESKATHGLLQFHKMLRSQVLTLTWTLTLTLTLGTWMPFCPRPGPCPHHHRHSPGYFSALRFRLGKNVTHALFTCCQAQKYDLFFLFGRRLLCRAGARSAEKFWM